MRRVTVRLSRRYSSHAIRRCSSSIAQQIHLYTKDEIQQIKLDNNDSQQMLMQQVSYRLAYNLSQVEAWKELVNTNILQQQQAPIDNTREKQQHDTKEQNVIIRTSTFHTPVWKLPTPAAKRDCREALNILSHLHMLHYDTHRLVATSSNSNNIPAVLKEVTARHSHSIEHVANLTLALRPHLQQDNQEYYYKILYSFLRVRFSVLLLCDTHRRLLRGLPALFVSSQNDNTDIRDLVQDAVSEAQMLVEAHYSIPPPKVNIVNTSDFKITLVPSWLVYVLVELLKNSLSITLDRYNCDNRPVTIEIGEHAITVHDQAGGFKGKKHNNDFAQTTQVWDRLSDQQTYAMVRSPLKGLGVGLALSRVLMQHFGGDVTLVENDGKGCSAVVKYAKNNDTVERLFE